MAQLGNLINVSNDGAFYWVWLESVGVVCVSVSFRKCLQHSGAYVGHYWCLEVGVVHLDSVSSVVVSQWVWLESVGVVCVSPNG